MGNVAKRSASFLAPFIAALLTFAGSAHAVLDTSDITDAITAAATAIGVIGLAVVVMIVGAKVFKWLRRAL